jgi:hypothetical protein
MCRRRGFSIRSTDLYTSRQRERDERELVVYRAGALILIFGSGGMLVVTFGHASFRIIEERVWIPRRHESARNRKLSISENISVDNSLTDSFLERCQFDLLTLFSRCIFQVGFLGLLKALVSWSFLFWVNFLRSVLPLTYLITLALFTLRLFLTLTLTHQDQTQ